jgi:hypothetical protein
MPASADRQRRAPVFDAVAHRLRTGHALQRMTRAVQTSAPSSISAWLCAHVAFPVRGRTAVASLHNSR